MVVVLNPKQNSSVEQSAWRRGEGIGFGVLLPLSLARCLAALVTTATTHAVSNLSGAPGNDMLVVHSVEARLWWYLGPRSFGGYWPSLTAVVFFTRVSGLGVAQRLVFLVCSRRARGVCFQSESLVTGPSQLFSLQLHVCHDVRVADDALVGGENPERCSLP